MMALSNDESDSAKASLFHSLSFSGSRQGNAVQDKVPRNVVHTGEGGGNGNGNESFEPLLWSLCW